MRANEQSARAVQILIGHTKIENALLLAERTEI
jgi:hypothetical protein